MRARKSVNSSGMVHKHSGLIDSHTGTIHSLAVTVTGVQHVLLLSTVLCAHSLKLLQKRFGFHILILTLLQSNSHITIIVCT